MKEVFFFGVLCGTMVMAVECLPCQQTDLYVQVQSLGKKLRYRQHNFFKF